MRYLLPAGAVVMIIVLCGCNMPRGMNEDCAWPSEADRALNPRHATDRRHLVNDVRVAEELGVRYEDSRLRRGDITAGAPQTRDECDARLFRTIADTHGLTLRQVHAARRHLADFGWDSAVHLPLAFLYALLASGLARMIRNRFSADEKPAAVLATLFVSLVLGGIMLAFGQLWDGFVEMARVGNQHLTYRALRLGWRQYSGIVFGVSVVLFWVAVLLSYRAPQRSDSAWSAPLRLRKEG